MNKSTILSLILIPLIILLESNFATAQVIAPKARGTPSEGPTIDQAQQEDSMGPKARVAVTRFLDKSAKGHYTGEIGDGMAEMLANELFATNRYIVLERQSLADVIREQDLGASGRVRAETAARIAEIEGADLLIEGTITEFEPGTSGAGGGGLGFLPGKAGMIGKVIGGIAAGIRTSHVALIVKVIDASTGRRLASEQIEGKATDIGGVTGMAGGGLAGVFGGYSKTPMEKAIRIAIEEAVRLIVAKTPAEYFRTSPTPQTQAASPAATAAPSQAVYATPTPSQPSANNSESEPHIVYVKWPTAGLREGPGTDFKAVAEVKKGTCLAVLEDKGQWLRVGLEDGREGWVGKVTTSDNP